MFFLVRWIRAAVVSVVALAGVPAARASIVGPPPPLPVASNKSDCGWGLAGSAAIAGLLGATQNNSASTGKWSGFYAGGQLGCAFDATKWTFQNVNVGLPNDFNSAAGQSATFKHNPLRFGGIAGYNFQFGNVVAGAELTLSSGLNSQIAGPFNQQPTLESQKFASSIGQIFTATGRVGYLVDPRWMLFAKGGLATANVTANLQGAAAPATFYSSSASNRMTGFTLGTGAEYQLTRNWNLGVGYDYYNLGSQTFSVACATCSTPILLGVNPVVHAVQGRLAYRFD